MISVIIPTRNAESTLERTLACLVPAAIEGLVRQVIVADGGSDDRTITIAEDAGADIVHAAPGRGQQLIAGASEARHPWLLFLHADTELAADWAMAAVTFIDEVGRGQRPQSAAAFRFHLDDSGVWPRLVERGVALRCRMFGLAYGDQGLLISRALYDRIGGYKPIALMEDVDLVRRLGKERLTILESTATTSAARYRESGYARRIVRNVLCLGLHGFGASPDRIAELYDRRGLVSPRQSAERARGKA